MNKRIIILITGFILVMIVIQFFPVDKSVPETDPALDFLVVTNPPRKIIAMVKTSCYDCHSYKTRYPWYSDVAPVSWLLKSHINEGRKNLNLSEFGNYSREEKTFAMAAMKKEIADKEMPLKSYLLIHKEARLSNEMRDALVNWLSTGKNEIELP